jgi:hypothetical protein
MRAGCSRLCRAPHHLRPATLHHLRIVSMACPGPQGAVPDALGALDPAAACEPIVLAELGEDGQRVPEAVVIPASPSAGCFRPHGTELRLHAVDRFQLRRRQSGGRGIGIARARFPSLTFLYLTFLYVGIILGRRFGLTWVSR